MRRRYRVQLIVGLTALAILLGFLVAQMAGVKLPSLIPATPTPTTQVVTTVTTTNGSLPISTQDQTDREREELVRLIIGFEQAFFARYPDDDMSAYLERLVPYASQEFLDQLDPEIFEQEPFLTSRVDGPVQAVVSELDVNLQFAGELADTQWVDVEVELDLEQTTSNGVVVKRSDLVHFTGWRMIDAGWKVFPVPPR